MSTDIGKPESPEVANIENIVSASEPQFDPSLEKVNVKQGDVALQFTIENGSISWTEEEEHVVLWKIDLRLVPLVSFLPSSHDCANVRRCWLLQCFYTATLRRTEPRPFSE